MTSTKMWNGLSRGLGFDHNPLRRRCDLIAAWLLPGIIAALLTLGPAVAFGASHWASAQNHAALQAERSWKHVPAVLLRSAPGPMFAGGGANSWIVWTTARWTADGVAHVGQVPAVSDSRAGTVLTVWLDQAGKVRRPLTAAAASNRTETAIGISLGALALLLAALAVIARRLLDARRLSGWETDWLLVGPQWTQQR